MTEPQIIARGTKYTQATEASLVRDVSDKIYLLQPDAAPLTTFTRGIGGKQVANNPKIEWFEDDLLPNVVVVSGSIGTSTTIDVVAGTGARVKAGDLLVAPSGESIYVSSVSTDALTVLRSMGAVASDTLADADQLIIASTAFQEGADNAASKFTKKETVTNYIQIFKSSVEMTEVQAASESYGGDDRQYQRMKKAIEHKRDIEQAFLFGDGFEYTTGTQALRGTYGALRYITTNVTAITGGVITEAEFEAFMRTLFRYKASVTSPTKLFLASPIMCSAINFWAKNSLQVTSNEKTFGVRIAAYRSAHGDLDIVNHWLLGDYTQAGGGLTAIGNLNFAFDPQNLKYRFLKGLDTKLHLDTQAKYSAKHLDEYRTYCALQLMQEKTHGIISGVTGFAA